MEASPGPKDKQRVFVVRFIFHENNIQVQTQSSNVSPQESLGLLDMAKDQILDNLKKSRSEMYYTESRGDKR